MKPRPENRSNFNYTRDIPYIIDCIPAIDAFLDWLLTGRPGTYVGCGFGAAAAGGAGGMFTANGGTALAGAVGGWIIGKDLDSAFGISNCIGGYLAPIIGPGTRTPPRTIWDIDIKR